MLCNRTVHLKKRKKKKRVSIPSGKDLPVFVFSVFVRAESLAEGSAHNTSESRSGYSAGKKKRVMPIPATRATIGMDFSKG
jgi:hypothetical protein